MPIAASRFSVAETCETIVPLSEQSRDGLTDAQRNLAAYLRELTHSAAALQTTEAINGQYKQRIDSVLGALKLGCTAQVKLLETIPKSDVHFPLQQLSEHTKWCSEAGADISACSMSALNDAAATFDSSLKHAGADIASRLSRCAVRLERQCQQVFTGDRQGDVTRLFSCGSDRPPACHQQVLGWRSCHRCSLDAACSARRAAVASAARDMCSSSSERADQRKAVEDGVEGILRLLSSRQKMLSKSAAKLSSASAERLQALVTLSEKQ